jgi:hypothetical protein
MFASDIFLTTVFVHVMSLLDGDAGVGGWQFGCVDYPFSAPDLNLPPI